MHDSARIHMPWQLIKYGKYEKGRRLKGDSKVLNLAEM